MRARWPEEAASLPSQSHERRTKRFRQGDIRRVISRKVVAQLPDTGQKQVVRVAVDGKITHSLESGPTALGRDLRPRHVPTNYLRDFEVHDMRRMECFVNMMHPILNSGCGDSAQQHFPTTEASTTITPGRDLRG